MIRSLGWMVTVLMMVGMVGCTVREQQGGFGFQEPIAQQSEITFDGWVRWVEYGQGTESGNEFWRLLANDGNAFDPVSIPLEFQHNGLAIRATVTPLPTVGNDGLWMTPVYIKSIRVLDGS